jgi:hypothetical protein
VKDLAGRGFDNQPALDLCVDLFGEAGWKNILYASDLVIISILDFRAMNDGL